MRFLNQNRSLSLVVAVLSAAVLLWLALLPLTPADDEFSEGQVAARTILAPRDISFVSPALTAQRQEEAAAAVPEAFTFDPSVAANQQAQLNTLLLRVRAILDDPNMSPTARSAALGRVDKLSLSAGSLALLRDMTPGDFSLVDTEARRALASVFEESLPSSMVVETQARSSTYVSPEIGREISTLIGEVIRPFIVSNQVVDRTRSHEARASARQSVAPVQVSYARNQVIVERDSLVTPEAREALREAGLIDSGWQLDQVVASAILGAVAAVTIYAGLHALRPSIIPWQVLAISLTVALPVFALKVYLPLILPDEDRHFLAYILPTAVAAMVLAGFIGAELALLAASLTAVLAAFATVLLLDVTVGGGGTLDVMRIALVTGLASAAGVFAVRNAERLVQFLVGGVFVAVSVFAVLFASWLIDPDRKMADLTWLALAAVANGGLSAFLSAGIFVTLGGLLGVTTRLQLLEMSQLSQPLLLRLQDEAPSTFQHSVIVANLAEKGAHVIGADALLARVGCYYHDIGKLARPGYFIENQLGGANPHDALKPADSARIISDHVKDGLALAAQYRLPAKVAAFIPEHHGTRFVAYFYRRAAEEDPEADISGFRYPGPKPQTRETAISMLADSSEAAVRSNPNHSPESIDRIVDEVFTERLTEGELDESNITLRDLREVAQSFKTTLKAVYHPRIEYPAPSEVELLLRRLPFRGRVISNR
jgi:putative nucleotidyltransferase with HDIG domain